MRIFARLRLSLLARRQVALTAGLFALWLQLAAFAAPMPGMADFAPFDPLLGAAHCLDAGAASGTQGHDPTPAGKSQTPCPQCPLCQTLQILASTPVPPPAIELAESIVPPAQPARPESEQARDTASVTSGFLSRAPPSV